ncbi:tetratricopeptide repeat protein [Aquimarina aquimarini]|uniref:tetratricopeptide repeat protein n=1 Tax=Aquimarina aquimarini TaxID=1191734 RepID=UPI000D54EAC2|nr:tetratricopeptide repeat protein [Aquimarina aquimarini]
MRKILSILLCFQLGIVFSQEESADKTIKEANVFVATANDVLVKEGNFPRAEGEYRRAIAKNPVTPVAKYNLGNAYYNSEKYDEATYRYAEAAKVATTKTERHKVFHNQGNTYMEQKKYKEAVEAYKNALRNNPKDDETRYNLALAKKMLEKKQQENKDKKGQDKEDKKDQDKKDQDKKEEEKDKGDKEKDKEGDKGDKEEEKDKGDKEKDKEGDQKDKKEDKDKEGDKEDERGKPKDQDDKKGGPNQQQAQGKLSPEQIKRLLEAMNNHEKKVQDKINLIKAHRSKVKTDKDW